MPFSVYYYPFVVLETHIDVFGHMNNGRYLTLFEEARWDMITKNGYGLDKIIKTGLGPVILEIKLKFLKEARVRQKIVIETKIQERKRLVVTLAQTMVRGNEVCCTAEVVCGLFSLEKRKLVSATPEWLAALGLTKNLYHLGE